MERQCLVAVVSGDSVRRRAIESAFAAAGFETVAGARADDVSIPDPATPVWFVLDGFQPGALDSEVSRARRRYPLADVWAVSETARLVATWRADDGAAEPGAAEPGAEYLSCEGILQGAIEALAPAEQEVGSILDALPDPLFVVSRDHVVVLANRALCDLAGKRPDDVLGRSCSDLLDGFSPDAPLPADGVARWQLDNAHSRSSFECAAFLVTLSDGTAGTAYRLHALGSGGVEA